MTDFEELNYLNHLNQVLEIENNDDYLVLNDRNDRNN